MFLKTNASPTSSASEPDGTVTYDFTASSSFELTTTAGVPIWIVEEDDGSGWTKVNDGKKSGLVPSSYLQLNAATPKHTKTSTANGKRGGLLVLRAVRSLPAEVRPQVRGLYAYAAQGDDEIAVKLGGIITLTPNGESYGDGWYEGIDSNGRQVRPYSMLPPNSVADAHVTGSLP